MIRLSSQTIVEAIEVLVEDHDGCNGWLIIEDMKVVGQINIR
ncbi:hypothetical protein HanIR_Chr11g0516661 [Helianthus annuus]|nr:hypothetical protein HanIR_Chr11g0516661 [Helianthus annuus]